MKREFNKLLKRIKSYTNKPDEKKLLKAYEFSAKAYEGHLRYSGDPVLRHTLETAKILSTLKADQDAIIAAMLHEILDYTDYKIKDIEKNFGKKVANLVSGVERIATVKTSNKDNEIETLRKMLLAMARDLRVVLIKLADRLHNMQTLEFHSREKQKKIANETLEIFVPIASRLGVYSLRSSLEDLCFKFLNQKEYVNIQEQLKLLGKKRKNIIEEITGIVKSFMKKLKIKGEVVGRFKNVYSIYRKLKKKGKTSIDEIHDIFAIRIVLPTKTEKDGTEDTSGLYHLIGLIHNKWKPLPGRFKDYIGFPKPNGYKSLHTTVIGLAPHSYKEPVEIQIRSEQMHEEAEYGIAAHWLYSEKGKSSNANLKSSAQKEWLTKLNKFSEQIEKGIKTEDMNEIKVNLFDDRIFVFTPEGEVRDLPVGSTPIDFGYSIHTDVGNRCTMAKSDGKIVPLDYELQNGEVVEIVTKPKSEPKLEWLSFVKTSMARNKIKNFYKTFDKDNNFKVGKELLNSKLDQLGKAKLDPKLTILKNFDDKGFNLKEREDLVRQVGIGTILPSVVIKRVFSKEDLFGEEIKYQQQTKEVKFNKEKDLSNNIIVGGERGMPVKLAKCCNPSFGQKIIGNITRGNAISIHKRDCRIIKLSKTKRQLSASWVGVLDDEDLRQVSLSIQTIPDVNIMREITKIINNNSGNILNFLIKKETDQNILWELLIEINDFDHFDFILNKLSNTNGVNLVRKTA